MNLKKLLKALKKLQKENGENFNPAVYLKDGDGDFEAIGGVELDDDKDLIIW
jgi:hypothetical protein